MLRALNFLVHHHFSHRDLNLNVMPNLRSYLPSIYHNIKETVTTQPEQFKQPLKILAEEDATVCYDTPSPYARLLQFHLERIPNPVTLPQLREYVTKVLSEKVGPITRRKFGSIGSHTILQLPGLHSHKNSKSTCEA